jgi:putative glutamine amidotransferase
MTREAKLSTKLGVVQYELRSEKRKLMAETFKVLITGEEGFDPLDGTANHVVRRYWAQQLDAANILPFTPLEPGLAATYADLADGLLLSDGAPVHPARFGGYCTDFRDLLAVSGRRDEMEFTLLEQFLVRGKPVLGLGRGVSILGTVITAQNNQQIFTSVAENDKQAHTSFEAFVHAVRNGSHNRIDGSSLTAADGHNSAGVQRQPRILLAGAPAYDRLRQEPSILINHTYVAALTQAGGAPLLAFPLIERAHTYAAKADALVLTGTSMFAPSFDLLPRLFAEEEPLRNRFDEAIYAAFRQAGKPILGICLGHQVINRYEGGSLIHDFKLQDGVEHMGTAHIVKVEPGTVLYQLFGEKLRVNSRHNNRVDQIAPTLRSTAVSPDGVVEALEHRELPILTVQWHPERSRGDQPEPFDATDPTPLFRHFIQRATSHIRH